MVRSSSARGVDEDKQAEKVFDELIGKIEDADFDLPPVLKEWKLGYYVPIKRNVYLTKRRIEDDGIFCSCTPSSGSQVACGKDCQCGMLFSCCSADCKCDSTCANKSFQHRPLKQTRLIKISHPALCVHVGEAEPGNRLLGSVHAYLGSAEELFAGTQERSAIADESGSCVHRKLGCYTHRSDVICSTDHVHRGWSACTEKGGADIGRTD